MAIPADGVAPAQLAEIDGVTLSEPALSMADVWEQVKNDTRPAFALAERRLHQRIKIPDEALSGGRPIAIALLSDLHLGSSGTDYEAAYNDATIVAATEGFYASFHGDGVDNWIIGKLAGLQRYQAIPFKKELMLFVDWLDILKERFLWVVPGNHDNWTEKLSGIDVVANALRGCKALYDPNQVIFRLSIGNASHLIKIRHKWRYGSIYNSTHGIEVGYDRGDTQFDIGIGGHTHITTVCRPFWRHDSERWAILTGAYKRLDKFGEELGFPSTKASGGAALVFWPDGRKLFMPDIQTAASYLAYERSKGENDAAQRCTNGSGMVSG